MSITFDQPEHFEKHVVSAGSHHAVVHSVHDLGLQKNSYLGEIKMQRQVVVVFEIVDEQIPDGDFKGKNHVVSKRYTKSLGDKANLRLDLKNWRGKDFTNEEISKFDLESIVGKNCIISVTHKTTKKGNTWVNIGSIAKLMPGMEEKKCTLEKNHEFKWIKKLQSIALKEDTPAEPTDSYGGFEDDEVPF